jgi:hypothetical protein
MGDGVMRSAKALLLHLGESTAFTLQRMTWRLGVKFLSSALLIFKSSKNGVRILKKGL